ncbi:Bone morphogenetic protein 7 [Orchesella cincta]|uniref:Bone morphogenetic protein 7 n=1 Tax=Orchesella cincta TaxID=48709 RepID=A0A1D2MIM6_ORCCI|nr:Bone morphogenetic protein 7 [Orchesella cincta]
MDSTVEPSEEISVTRNQSQVITGTSESNLQGQNPTPSVLDIVLPSIPQSIPEQNETKNDEKAELVKHRAVRSLMQIFGIPNDTVLMRTTDQFGPAPEFMIDLYNTITDTYGVTRAKNPYGAHVIRSFMERDSSKYDFFYFNLSANVKLKESERVVEAELHLYRNPTPHDRLHPSLYLTPFYILSLYQVVDTRNLAIPDLHKLLGVHYVPALGSGWEVFNVTQTVLEWMKGEKQNMGFIVAATSLGGDRVPITFSRRSDAKEGEKSNKQPILVLFNHDSEGDKLKSMTSNREPIPPNNRRRKERGKVNRSGENNNQNDYEEEDDAVALPNLPNSSLENPRFHHSLLFKDTIRHPNSVSRFRSRRSKNQTEHGDTSDAANHPKNITSCSKHDLFISFEAIGWSSWIISPKGYNAYYCVGPCIFPLSHEVSPTNHATLQSIAHELSLAPDVGRPCCVPTKLLPISLLYYDDDDNVVLKQYVDMVADTCGCH